MPRRRWFSQLAAKARNTIHDSRFLRLRVRLILPLPFALVLGQLVLMAVEGMFLEFVPRKEDLSIGTLHTRPGLRFAIILPLMLNLKLVGIWWLLLLIANVES